MAKMQVKKSKTKQLLFILFFFPLIVLLLGILWFFISLMIRSYCQKQARNIVGDQWNTLYKAVGYEKQYADQIAWGFREQLKCEHRFPLLR